MKHTLAPAFLLMACLALHAPAPITAAEKESTGDWQSLFNGENLNGWEPVGTAVWRVEDGVLVGTQDGDPSRSGLLMTTREFGDFELVLDFMIDEHGKYNSGIYLRRDPSGRRGSAYQVNIGRGAAGEYAGGLHLEEWLAKGDEDDTIRRKRDWNTMRIVADGGHIIVDLNGVNVVDYTAPNPAEELLKPGVLALQTYGAEGHAGWVKFRNLRIRELP